MNKMNIREDIYNEICRTLTDYENPEEGLDCVTESDLYSLLVKIQNNWEEIINN